MNLQEIYTSEPPESSVVEFENGVKILPVLEVKKMLHLDFDKWETREFKGEYIQRGHDLFYSCSVELTLWKENDVMTFVGATCFNTKNYETLTEGELNDNYAATGLSLSIVNAAKNLGRRYGMFFNSKKIEDYQLPNKTKSEKTPMDNTIKNILKNTK